MRNLKLLSALFAFAVFLAGGSVVYGGLSWTGMDPEILVDGQKFNVYVEWPEGDVCLIDGPIDVDFWYPKGTDANHIEVELVMETDASFPCDHSSNSSLVDENGMIHVLSKTNLKDGTESDSNEGGILLAVKVNTSEQMPVRAYLYHNSPGLDENGKPLGTPVQLCEGFSDDFVFCDPLPFDSVVTASAGDDSCYAEEEEVAVVAPTTNNERKRNKGKRRGKR